MSDIDNSFEIRKIRHALESIASSLAIIAGKN